MDNLGVFVKGIARGIFFSLAAFAIATLMALATAGLFGFDYNSHYADVFFFIYFVGGIIGIIVWKIGDIL